MNFGIDFHGGLMPSFLPSVSSAAASSEKSRTSAGLADEWSPDVRAHTHSCTNTGSTVTNRMQTLLVLLHFNLIHEAPRGRRPRGTGAFNHVGC